MAAIMRRARPLSWARVATERKVVTSSSVQFAGTPRPFGTMVNVILTDDVMGTGYKGEEVEVRGGFMRNYLFPKKRAIYATIDNKIQYNSLDRTAEKARASALKALKRGRQEMAAMTIVLKRNMLPSGKQIDGDVTAKDIVNFLRKNNQFEGTEEGVRLTKRQSITSFGEHLVLVRMELPEQEKILTDELGVRGFEEQRWVEMRVHVEREKTGQEPILDNSNAA